MTRAELAKQGIWARRWQSSEVLEDDVTTSDVIRAVWAESATAETE